MLRRVIQTALVSLALMTPSVALAPTALAHGDESHLCNARAEVCEDIYDQHAQPSNTMTTVLYIASGAVVAAGVVAGTMFLRSKRKKPASTGKPSSKQS